MKAAARVMAPPSLPPTHPDYHRALFTVAQAAAQLAISPKQLYGLAAAQRIGHERLWVAKNARLAFSQADIDDYAKSRRVEVARPVGITAPLRLAAGARTRSRSVPRPKASGEGFNGTAFDVG